MSRCRVVPLKLRVGSATIRVDGIGLMETLEEHRHRGYGRRVLNAALDYMQAGDASISMLYGITDFYPKFGYATVGPESTIALPPLATQPVGSDGRIARPFHRSDLPAVRRLYDDATERAVGAAVRGSDYPWSVLLASLKGETSDDCRVMEGEGGRIAAYVWRGEHLQFVQAHSEFNPRSLVLAEVVADGPWSADAALRVSGQWAAEEALRREQSTDGVLFFQAHEGPVAAATMHMPATLRRGYGPDGGWMARVMSAERLFESLQPEISRRLAANTLSFQGRLQVLTEAGDVSLTVAPRGVTVAAGSPEDAVMPGEMLVCRLSQTTLAQLVIGAFPPDDLLARLPHLPEDRVIQLLSAMFPSTSAQIYLADRF